MKKSTKTLLIIICAVLACVFAFSGYKLISILSEYKQSADMYNNLEDEFVASKPGEAPGGQDKEKQEELPEETAPLEESPISVDFESLMAKSEDLVGWLYSANTKINYPVVLGDDNFFYLDKFIDGSYNGSGSLFLDCTCAGDFSCLNTVIYGHNMNDGSMLASIVYYREAEYYAEHPVLYLNTPEQNYRLEVFSAYITDAESDSYTMYFNDSTHFETYLKSIISQSDIQTDVAVSAQDRIITLSTCTYEYNNARYVVHCKLVPIL